MWLMPVRALSCQITRVIAVRANRSSREFMSREKYLRSVRNLPEKAWCSLSGRLLIKYHTSKNQTTRRIRENRPRPRLMFCRFAFTPRTKSMNSTDAITVPILRTTDQASRFMSPISVKRGKNASEMAKPVMKNRLRNTRTALNPSTIMVTLSIRQTTTVLMI